MPTRYIYEKGVEMIDKNLFGKRLKELREKRGMTQEELSNLLDIEWQHVSRLENGKNLPSCSILISLANVFDIDIREFTEYEHLNPENNVDNSINKLLSLATNEQKKVIFRIIQAILK
jgi:transcriptional regulator with XRE-family HTH domain